MRITSVQNEKVKEYVKLMKQKKERDRRSQFIVEGEHLVFEALKEDVVLEIMILEGTTFAIDREYITVTSDIMNKICDTKTPQGIIALCSQKKSTLTNVNRVLILDDIRDPGNLGTIIRSADAFSFDAVVLSDQTVDLYNPKVVRSTQGAIFRVNVVRKDILETIEILKRMGVTIYAADLDGLPMASVKETEKLAFVMGNEAQGISEAVREVVDHRLTIEMLGSSESLNVSIAASIIMYNFRK